MYFPATWIDFISGAKNVTQHSRTRRSCFGRGRERRSCVGVKDPPPKGVYKADVPQYDPSADVNYTFRITQSSCLYWSEDEEKWSSYSCKICPPQHVAITEGGTYFYDLVISTGVWKNSGTTANVTIGINGNMNEHSIILPRGDGDSRETFARGGIDGFVLITDKSIGPLTEITIEHDNSGKNPSWFVETVTIGDRQNDDQWLFTMNRWLALDQDDGEIEVTVENHSFTSFSDKLRLYFGRKLVDNHMWVSVIYKACSSTFTRVQRASCCLSLLFSAMIASAMFYNIGGESDIAIQVGPFKFTWRQVVIGVQSGLIVAPVNILIVFIFKYSRPRGRTGHTRKGEQGHHLVYKIRDQGCMLPQSSVYVAWFLCFATTLTAAFFTVLYSLTFGKEKSEQWLASFMISFAQDIFVLQPTKAIMAVILIVLLWSRNKDNDRGFHSNRGYPYRIDIKCLNNDPRARLKRYKLEAMRARTKKEAQLAGIVKKIIVHLVFFFFLAVVCYGNKNENRFLMTRAMRTPIK